MCSPCPRLYIAAAVVISTTARSEALTWVLLHCSQTLVDHCNLCVQVFSLSKEDELRREEVCADARGHDSDTVSMLHCHGHHGNQQWKHDRVMTSHPSSPRSKPTSCHNPSNHRLLLSLRSSITLPDHTVVRTRDSKVWLRAILSSDNSFKQFVHTRASVAMTTTTTTTV